ncbi:MAG: PIN domain-containing protein [Candidatus Bilamarchaeaceae archaeon]
MFFYDSYAILEFVRGNSTYKRYFPAKGCATTHFNLVEVYYCLLRTVGKDTAEKVYESFISICAEPDHGLLKRAMEKRLELVGSGKNISYADAVGYQFALEHNLKFLTGDMEFEKLANVEFVK